MNNNSNTLSDSALTTKQKLSFLWIFAVANYIFCDFSSLLHPESLNFEWRSTGVAWKDTLTLQLSRVLSLAIIMQLPILMILLSVLLPYKSNRLANITTGLLMIFTIGLMMAIFIGLTDDVDRVQFGEKFLYYIFVTLFGDSALHFIFFSIIEIATMLSIVWIAFNWSDR